MFVRFNTKRALEMIFGYARISTKTQSIDRQIRNIEREYPNAKMYKEAFTGTKIDRPEFRKLLSLLKKGDTIVFDSVSRMSRDAQEGFCLYQKLYGEGIELVFLKEHHIDTATYRKALNNSIELTGTNVDFILQGVNKYLMALAEEQIKIAFEQAQKEVDDLHQRTKEGIETARRKGQQIGQVKGSKLNVKKEKPAKETILKYSKNFNGTMKDVEVQKLTGLSRNTYYKYKRELKGEC